MMLQSLYLAGCFAIYATCDWLMTAGADLFIQLLKVIA